MKRNKFLFSFAFVLLALASFSQYVSIAFSVVSNVSFTRYSLVSVTAAVSAYLCIYERKSAIYPMQHLFTTATQTHTHTRTEYTQRAHEKLTRWYDGVWCRLYNVQLTPICNVHLVTKSKQEWRGSEWECERNECNATASSSEIHHRKHIYVLHTNSKLPFFIRL